MCTKATQVVSVSVCVFSALCFWLGERISQNIIEDFGVFLSVAFVILGAVSFASITIFSKKIISTQNEGESK
jgi:purine-cytosine permease-like protein